MGKVVGLLYVWYFLHQTAITLRVFESFMDTRFFPSTPRGVITAAILMVAAYVLFHGLETLGRCSEVLVPYILFGIVLIVLFVLNHADWKNLTPLFENGLGPVIYGAVPTTTRWAEFAWMAMIIPFVVDKKKIKNAVFTGIVVTNVYFLILMVPIVAVFGSALTANTQFPTYALVEVISVGQFFERIDAVLLGMWVFGAFLKIGIFYYVSVLGAAQLFGVQDKQPLILPIGLLIFVLSLFLFSNIVELRAFGKTMMSYDFLFIFIIPSILLLAHWARKQFR